MSEFDRQPDTVVFTFETTIDYVVDLRDGSVKVGEVGELADDWHYVALFCEGEFAGESGDGFEGLEDGDQKLIDKAADLMNAAFEDGTVKDDSTEQPV